MSSSIARLYTDELKRQWVKFHANWDPTEPVQLGDFGLLDGNIFDRWGNVDSRGITVTPRVGQRDAHYEYTSSSGVEIGFVAKGSTLSTGAVAARAALEIGFSKENAIFFNAAGCTVSSVEDREALGRAVLTLLQQNEWNPAYAVVTSVVEAGATTILMSSTANAAVTLEAETDATEHINLADAQVRMSLGRRRSVGLQISTREGLVPLIGLSKVRPKRWPIRRRPGFGRASFMDLEKDALIEVLEGEGEFEELYFGEM